MKIFTCLALIDLTKLIYLKQVLYSQKLIFKEVHVAILTNKVDPLEIEEILSVAPVNTSNFKVEVINRDYEKFQDPTYTHFMNIEDDMLVTSSNVNYWLMAREFLRPYNLYPSFLRVEWSKDKKTWVSVDAIDGDNFSIRNCPRITVREGYGYINIPRIYQGMFLYDRDLMQEYIGSGKYVVDEAFPNWYDAIQFKNSPLGLGEASHTGLSQLNVPPGCISRNFLPYFENYHMIDPACFIHHLPNKFANTPDSGHGKVSLQNILIP